MESDLLPQSDTTTRPLRRRHGSAAPHAAVGRFLLHVPPGMTAFAWCRAGDIRYGYAWPQAGGALTLDFDTVDERTRVMAIIKARCAALAPYNPALAKLYDAVH